MKEIITPATKFKIYHDAPNKYWSHFADASSLVRLWNLQKPREFDPHDYKNMIKYLNEKAQSST